MWSMMSGERVHGPCWTAAKVSAVSGERGVLRVAQSSINRENGGKNQAVRRERRGSGSSGMEMAQA